MKPFIIGITGPLGGGKSTFAKCLEREFGYQRLRFAGILKDMCVTLGLDQAQVDGNKKMVPDHSILCGKTPRWAMQSLGTEWGRKCIGQDVWVNATMAKIAKMKLGRRMPLYVVIDDVRFPNEVEAIRDKGGIIIKVCGRDPEAEDLAYGTWYQRLWWKVSRTGPHLSEVYWRQIEADHTVYNLPEYDERDLQEWARIIMEKYQ